MLYGIETENIRTREDFIEFLELFFNDYQNNKNEWENNTLERFLESMITYTEDVQQMYVNNKTELDANKPSWRVFADILCGAAIYE